MSSDHRYVHGFKQPIQICSSFTKMHYMEDWIPLTPVEQMAHTDYDVIIVGTGAGGSSVLWRLCEKWRRTGKRIAVIERGDLLLPTHAMNLPTLNYERMLRFMENPNVRQPIPSEPCSLGIPSDFAEYFAFGGRTLFWGAGSPRLHPRDFQTYPFPYQELHPYYKTAERLMGVSRNLTKASSIQQIILGRLHAMGYVDATHFPLAIGAYRKNGLHVTGVFSAMNLFGHALSVRGFDLAVNARVVRVLTENGTVEGVQVITPDGKSYAVKGKIVVLAAGALGNPHILLHSGVQDESIGRYLANHSCVEAVGGFGFSNGKHDGLLAVFIPPTRRRRYQVEIHLRPIYDYAPEHDTTAVNGDLTMHMQGFGAIEPQYDNHVSLSQGDLDEYGIPKMIVQFRYSERDLRVIQQMISTMQDQVGGLGIGLHTPLCLKAPGGESHESGTCRMGSDPHISVTNQYGELHQVSNLFVADSSVLPYISGTNPTLTIVAVSTRTADYILDRL